MTTTASSSCGPSALGMTLDYPACGSAGVGEIDGHHLGKGNLLSARQGTTWDDHHHVRRLSGWNSGRHQLGAAEDLRGDGEAAASSETSTALETSDLPNLAESAA